MKEGSSSHSGKIYTGMSKQIKPSSESRDPLSDLPDFILRHIISFLPTRDAIITSFLSRRWKYLWTHIPNLDFDEDLFFEDKNLCCRTRLSCIASYCDNLLCRKQKIRKFVEFVDRTLLLHQGNFIEKFRISLYFREEYNAIVNVNEWYYFAMRSNVSELDINFSDGFIRGDFGYKYLYYIPGRFFASNTLRVLKLDYCVFEPSSFKVFGSLRSLFLTQVLLVDASIGDLVSKCPVLQDLSLITCCFPAKFMEYIPDLQLKTLIIEDCSVNLFGEGRSALIWVSFDIVTFETISISAPNLVSFKFRGKHPKAFSLKNSSQLVDAVILNDEYKIGNENDSICLNLLLKNLDNARALTLSSWSLKVLPIAGNHLESLSRLCNLKCLTLETELPKSNLPGLACLLRRSPNLETLVLNIGHSKIDSKDEFNTQFPDIYSFDERYYWESQRLPIDCLKKVEIKYFRGGNIVLDFVKFLLMNAMVLEDMVVSSCEGRSLRQGMNYSRVEIENICKLLSFPRVSSSAKIFFS